MNPGTRTFTLLLAAMVVGISTPVFTQMAPQDGGALLPTRLTINAQAGDQFDPHVDGDLAVYSHAQDVLATGPVQTIEYYRFSTGVRSTIPQPPGVQIADLLSGVDQGRIVFTRILPSQGPYGHAVIMLFNTATGTLLELAPIAESQRLNPSIGAQTVAFVDYQLADSSGEIMLFDLATSTLTQLTNDTVSDFGPAVSPDGNVVVWTRCAGVSNCDIYAATRSGDAWSVSPLSTSPLNERSPDTNGVDVVFHRENLGGPTGSNIVTVPVSGGAESELAIPGEQYSPSIHGSIISYESRVAFGNPDIHVYDLESNRYFQITDTTDSPESLNDVVVLPTGEVRVVWQGGTVNYAPESDMYAATFTLPPVPPTPPTGEALVQQARTTVIALSANAVTNQGNQNALMQFLSQVIAALQSGDLAIARQQLAHAIERTDGCALRGMPDGNGPSRDWITTCAAQSQVYPLLRDALAAITP